MASIFEGLGQALGAAAGGALRGQREGEAENYRRQQLEAQRAFQREMLGLRRRETDPNKLKKDTAARLYQDLVMKQRDEKMQGYMARNPGYARQLSADIIHLQNAMEGTADLDLGRFNYHAEIEREVYGDGGREAPQPPTLPPDEPGRFAVQAGPERVLQAPEMPEMQPLAPGRTAPEMERLVGRLARVSPAFAGVRPAAGPDTFIPGPTPGAAPSAPPSPLEQWQQFVAEPPQYEVLPGQTDVEARAVHQLAMQAWNAREEALRRSITLPDEAGRAGSEARLAGTKAAAAGIELPYTRKKVETDIRARRAAGTAAEETAATQRALRPGRQAQQGATLQKTQEETKAIPARLRQGEERIKQGWARVNQGRERLENALKLATEKAGRVEEGVLAADDRAVLAHARGILNKYKRTAAGSEVPAHAAEEIEAAKDDVAGVLNRMSQRRTRILSQKGTAKAAPKGGGAQAKGGRPTRAEMLAEAKRQRFSKEETRDYLKLGGY
jgi:hypothetical protein